MEIPDIALAMELLFGPILRKHADCESRPTALLLRCAACIVYHSDSLLSKMVSNPGHDFTKIAILHNKDLLDRLSLLVSTAPTNVVMNKPTGIPPHVELATQMKEVLSHVISLAQIQKDQTSTLVSTIEKAIDEKAYDSGNITGSRLREILASYQSESANLVDSRLLSVDDKLKKIQESFYQFASGNEDRQMINSQQNSIATNLTSRTNLYQYSSRL